MSYPGDRKALIPQFNPYLGIMISSLINLSWLIGAMDRKTSVDSD